jgi:hypothetical protein
LKPRYLILHDDPGWRVAKVSDRGGELRELDEQGDDGIAAVAKALKDWGCDGTGVVLGLPSSMVYAAQIDSTSLPRTQRRLAMLFRLEEKLPLDIERLTVDFLPPASGRLLGVAVETKRLAAMLEALTSAGVEPLLACPTALLALWQVCRKAPAWDYVVLADSRSVELFHLRDGQPITWYALPASTEQLMRSLRANHLADPAEAAEATVHVVGQCDGLLEALGQEAGLKLDTDASGSPAEPAAQAAAAAVDGDPAGWVDLRRDELAAPDPWRRAGRLVTSAIAMALLLPLLVAGASYWRSTRYAASVETARLQAETVYRQLNHLPDNAPILFDVRKRLETDLRRLAGVSGAAGQLPHQPNALETVRRVVSALPRGMRLRIVELRVGPAEIYIEGQVRSHGDAETLRAALVAAGIALDLPQTERLSGGGVSFTLVGLPAPEGSAPGATAAPAAGGGL